MMIIGLTGGIATGKSTVSKIIRENNIPVIDADEINKKLSKKNGAIWKAIHTNFGEEYIDEKGEINKVALSKLVFDEPEQRDRLNAVTHPLIKAEAIRLIQQIRDKDESDIVFIDVPLLFESGWDEMADETWVVAVPCEVQLQRLIMRDNCTIEDAEKRINSQMSLDEKCRKADIVIDNSSTIENTGNQVLKHLRRVTKKD